MHNTLCVFLKIFVGVYCNLYFNWFIKKKAFIVKLQDLFYVNDKNDERY